MQMLEKKKKRKRQRLWLSRSDAATTASSTNGVASFVSSLFFLLFLSSLPVRRAFPDAISPTGRSLTIPFRPIRKFPKSTLQTKSKKKKKTAASAPSSRPSVAANATSLQFIKGVDEPSVPDVSLTRSRDGSSGVATFVFENPSIFDASSDVGDITGLYLVDDEGTLSTVDVSAKFVNGKPDRIEAKYFMRSEFEWNRFLRFMERYAEDNQLGFSKKQQDE